MKCVISDCLENNAKGIVMIGDAWCLKHWIQSHPKRLEIACDAVKGMALRKWSSREDVEYYTDHV